MIASEILRILFTISSGFFFSFSHSSKIPSICPTFSFIERNLSTR